MQQNFQCSTTDLGGIRAAPTNRLSSRRKLKVAAAFACRTNGNNKHCDQDENVLRGQYIRCREYQGKATYSILNFQRNIVLPEVALYFGVETRGLISCSHNHNF